MSKPETVTIKYDAWNKDQDRLSQLQKTVDELNRLIISTRTTHESIIELNKREIERLSKTQTHGILNFFKLAFAHTKDKENVFLNLKLIERILNGKYSFDNTMRVNVDSMRLYKENF